MALPSFVNNTVRAANATSISPGLPPSMVAGDIVIIIAGTIAGGSLSITTAGSISTWTPITGSPQDVTGGEKLYLWWGRWTSGTTGPTITATSDHVVGLTVAYRGVSTVANPIHVTAASSEATSDTSFSFATGVSTTLNNCLCLCACSTGTDSNSIQFGNMANSSLTSLNNRIDTCTNTAGGGGFTLQEGAKVTAGTMGTWSVTMSGTATPKAYIAFALASDPVGTATITEAGDTVSADGTVTTAERIGTLNQTETDDHCYPLVDNFDDGTLSQIWIDSWTDGSASTLTEVNGRLKLSHTSSGSGCGLYTDYFNMEGSSVYWAMPVRTYPAIAGSSDTISCFDYLNVYIAFDFTADTVQMTVQEWTPTSNVLLNSSFTYVPNTHYWFRIRHETSDNKIYLDTAPITASNPPSSGDWVNRGVSSAFTTGHVRAVPFTFEGYPGSGAHTTEYDGFNTSVSEHIGTLTKTEDGDTVSADGTVSVPEIIGTLTKTEDGDILGIVAARNSHGVPGPAPFNLPFAYLASTQKRGKKFTAGVSGTVTQATIPLFKDDSPTGTITVSIWTHDGGTGKPGAMISESLGISTSSLSLNPIYFNFRGLGAAVTSGTSYWVVVSNSAVSLSNPLYVVPWLPSSSEANTSVVGDGSSWTLVESPESSGQVMDFEVVIGTADGTVSTVSSIGTLSVTEDGDTATLEGGVLVQGQLGSSYTLPPTYGGFMFGGLFQLYPVNDTGDTLTATGGEGGGATITGEASITEAADTLTAEGTIPALGAATITEAGDTLTASGTTPALGTATITEAGDTLSSAGTIPALGSASITEAGDTLSATGTIPAIGTAAITEASDTLSSTGVLSGPVGTATITEAGDTLSSTAVLSGPVGAASITEAGDTLSSTVAVQVLGTLTVTEASDTLSATAVLSGPVGTATITEAGDTLSASGTAPIIGSASITEAGDTLSSAGTVLVRGTATITEAGDTLSASSENVSSGTLTVSEAGDTLSSAGTIPILGTATITEQGDTVASAVSALILGVVVITEADDTLSSTGSSLVEIVGDLAVTEDDDTLSGSGSVVSPPGGGLTMYTTGGGGGYDPDQRDMIVRVMQDQKKKRQIERDDAEILAIIRSFLNNV